MDLGNIWSGADVSFFEDKIYTYTLEHDYYYNNPMHPKISKMLVCSDKKDQIWLTIQPGGIIGIPQGYAWDGCSPKITFFSTALCGIWDGPLLKDGYPTCYYPSLVHDALCQFAPLYVHFPYTFKQIDAIFLRMLQDAKWPYAERYYKAVRFWHSIGG